MHHHSRYSDALGALKTQALLIGALFPVVLYFWQAQAALSLLVGGVVCLLPNIYFYRRVFAYSGATQAKYIVKALYWGETIKIIMTAVCFVGALLISWVMPMWMFLGFVGAQFGFWLAPIYFSVKKITTIGL